MSRWADLVGLVNRACQSTFGVPVVYTPSLENRMELGGMPIALTGIFDEKREIVSLMGDGGMDAIIPRSVLEVGLAELGIEPMAGDDVTVAGVPYRILEVQLDGRGQAVLIRTFPKNFHPKSKAI
ncbi:MAG: hypothetical protein HQL91_14070 [Magnetococcales bacterium]|nr:hypothetical protein [Magnetococcales bacterium]